MTAVYSITLDDYLKANRTFARHTTRIRRINNFVARWVMVPLGALLLLESVLLAYARLYPMIFLTTAMGIFFVLWPWNRRRVLRRLYAQQRLGNEFELSMDDDGIHTERVDKSVNSSYRWTAIKRSVESPFEFLLLPDDIHMIILPKRVLSSQQQAEVRNFLRQHTPGFREVQ